jgi:hypothetical protein
MAGKNNSEEKGRRSEPRIWLYTEHWLWGSTRSEYDLSERAVFVDILALGITGLGKVDVTYPEQLAAQLCVPLDVFNRTVEKGIKYGKFARKVDKRRKKTFLLILNWRRYQPEYLHERPTRSTKRGRIAKRPKSDAHVGPLIVEDSIEENISSNSPSGTDLKTEFLHILREVQKAFGDVADKDQDERLFNYIIRKHPGLDPVHELKDIAALWKKKPDEVRQHLKSGRSIRTQLYALFDEAAKYAGVE